MINKYEERLGTERMLPLIFKMALPAVAARLSICFIALSIVYISDIFRASEPMRLPVSE